MEKMLCDNNIKHNQAYLMKNCHVYLDALSELLII